MNIFLLLLSLCISFSHSQSVHHADVLATWVYSAFIYQTKPALGTQAEYNYLFTLATLFFLLPSNINTSIIYLEYSNINTSFLSTVVEKHAKYSSCCLTTASFNGMGISLLVTPQQTRPETSFTSTSMAVSDCDFTLNLKQINHVG